MKIYFLSARPCALTVGGVYFGMTDGFEKFAEVHLQDNLPVRFQPENALPLCFFLNETIRFNPPAGCEVYLLLDGLAVYARDFTPVDFTLRPVAQERFETTLVTVYRQGALQLSVESDAGFFTAPLSPVFEDCKLRLESGVIVLEGKNAIAVYSTACEKLLEENVLGFSIENGVLRATLPLSDRYRRVAECTYTLSESGCERTDITLKQEESEPLGALLAYAFFESVLLGLDFEAFLCEELRQKAGDLQSFLGNYRYVLPTDDETVCRLVYEKSERLFDVREYAVTIENEKITDIRRV